MSLKMAKLKDRVALVTGAGWGDRADKILLQGIQFCAKEVLIQVKKQPPAVAGILDYAGVEIRRER
jgi:hypothetical protein